MFRRVRRRTLARKDKRKKELVRTQREHHLPPRSSYVHCITLLRISPIHTINNVQLYLNGVIR
eukprot:72491-Prorocentrum_minimum.AAC.7